MGGPGSGRKPKEKWQREEHTQLFDEMALTPPSAAVFAGTQFIAWLGQIRFNQTGGLTIAFSVPYELVDHALPLREAFMTGVPLSIDVQLWKPAAEAAFDSAVIMDDVNG